MRYIPSGRAGYARLFKLRTIFGKYPSGIRSRKLFNGLTLSKRLQKRSQL